MVHTGHRFKIYKNKTHILVAFGIITLPVIFIFLAGQITEISAQNLLTGIGLSLYRLAFAYAISLVIGVSLAVLLGQGKIGDFFVPIFDILQNLPSFALIPVFVILFGYTNKMAIIFAASSILWPILFYVLNAIKTAKLDFNEAATVFGATGIKRIFHYFIPLSFPAIITGSMVGIAIGWEAIIGIEIIGLSNGIGTFLKNAEIHNQASLVLGITALLLVVFAINKLIWLPLLKKSQLYGE